MSFNQKLRQAVYGNPRATRTNPLLKMPAGITGMTWQGTGFEQGPAEPILLNPATLPWELQQAPDSDADIQAASRGSSSVVHAGIGIAIVLAMIVVALIIVGAY